jgi:hypothetical protein
MTQTAQRPYRRLLHEANMFLFASEGRVDEALTEMEAMIAAGWRFLAGIGPDRADSYRYSNSHYWFEDNPILDSIRNDQTKQSDYLL